MIRGSLRSALFPYTTLFRSRMTCRWGASRSRGPAVSGYGQGRKDRSPTAAVEAHPAPAPETSPPPARRGGAPAEEKRGKRKTGLVRRGSRGDGVRSAAAIGVCPQGFLDQAVQELRRKVRAVRPGERLIDPEGRKIGRITQWLEHLAPQLGTQVHFAFEAVVEFEPHAVAIAIGCFDNFNDHDPTPLLQRRNLLERLTLRSQPPVLLQFCPMELIPFEDM